MAQADHTESYLDDTAQLSLQEDMNHKRGVIALLVAFVFYLLFRVRLARDADEGSLYGNAGALAHGAGPQ